MEQAADERPARKVRNRRRDARLATFGVIGVLLVWFAVANFQDVQIRFWITTSKAPLIVVIVISGLLGAAMSAVGARMARRRRRTDDGG